MTSRLRCSSHLVLALLVLLAGSALAAPPQRLQFKGQTTRVSFAGGKRTVSQWTVAFKVSPVRGAPTQSTAVAAPSVIELTNASTGKTDSYVVKSSYFTTTAVYLATRGGGAITLVFPETPKPKPGESAKAKAILLFSDDPVPATVDGEWFAARPAKRVR